jgi:hypothetical protein
LRIRYLYLTTYIGLECLHLIYYIHLKSHLDFRAYFKDVHYIKELRLNYVSRKRKSEDNKEEMQDTKGKALIYVSKKLKHRDEKGEGRNLGPTL